MPHLPVWITEWSSQNPAFIADTIRNCIGLTEAMSYWTFSNVFEENGVPSGIFNSTFGMLDQWGIARPSLHAFALLHKLGEKQLQAGEGPVLATERADGSLAMLVWNLIPEKNASFLANGRLDLSDKVSLFTNLMTSQSRVDARYAAPAASFVLNSSQIATYVDPKLTNGDTADTASDIAKVRLVGVGGRADGYKTNTLHAVIGTDVTMGKWDSTFSFTHSQHHWYDIAEGGYASANAIDALMKSGKFDPFSSDPQADVLASTVLHQTLDQSRSTLDILSAHTSTALATLPGG